MYIPSDNSNQMDEYYDFKNNELENGQHRGFTKYHELALFVAPDTAGRMRNYTVDKLTQNIDQAVYYADKPKIKIKSVTFGDNEPNINQDKFNGLHADFQNYLEERFNYNIDVNPNLFVTGIKS